MSDATILKSMLKHPKILKPHHVDKILNYDDAEIVKTGLSSISKEQPHLLKPHHVDKILNHEDKSVYTAGLASMPLNHAQFISALQHGTKQQTLAVHRNPHLPSDLIDKAITNRDYEGLKENPSLSTKQVNDIYGNPVASSKKVRYDMISHQNAGKQILDNAVRGTPEDQIALLKNTNHTKGHYDILKHNSNPDVRYAAMSSPHVRKEDLQRNILAANPNQKEVLELEMKEKFPNE